MVMKKSSNLPTPSGGVRSEMIYLDDNFNMVDESVATRSEIIEYDAEGNSIRRTYGVRRKDPDEKNVE